MNLPNHHRSRRFSLLQLGGFRCAFASCQLSLCCTPTHVLHTPTLLASILILILAALRCLCTRSFSASSVITQLSHHHHRQLWGCHQSLHPAVTAISCESLFPLCCRFTNRKNWNKRQRDQIRCMTFLSSVNLFSYGSIHPRFC